MGGFSHLDQHGRAIMVDVSAKSATARQALASVKVLLGREILRLLYDNSLPKGDVIAVSRVAGIMAAKKVDTLIPLCHPLPIHGVEINFTPDFENGSLLIEAMVKTAYLTGVEMEAMTAASVAALTVYDMCKGVEKGITITELRLEYKSGGKSGTWRREEEK